MANESTAPSFVPKEWNASGAIYPYGKRTQRSFVVEVYLTEDVQGDLLQKAVDKALERLPYYRMTLVRKKGLYYYADNDLPFEIAEHDGPRPMGGATTNYHMIDVTYFGKKIDFAMWHAFCDGLGLNRFIEAVLYHYMCLKDGVTYDSTGIYTDEIPYDEAETFDANAVKLKVNTKELRQLAAKEGRVELPELSESSPDDVLMQRLPLKIKTEDFISWCKANQSSPAAAVSAIMAKAVASELHPTEGTIMSIIPASLRKYLGAEKTFKNCTAAFMVPMQVEDVNTLATGELAAQARTTMKKQTGEQMGKVLFSVINMITHLGKKMPLYSIKSKIFALPENNPQHTFMVDYVGGLRANGYADQITDVRYLNVDPCGRASMILMSETAGHFHVNFTQTYETDRYYQAFCSILDEEGIPYEKLERDTYLNPAIEMPKKR